MILKQITNDEILSVWENLWPGRDQILVSDMCYPAGYDSTIHEIYKPTHWGFFINDQIVGCNSGHKTSNIHYRGRGVWVEKEYRRLGISQILWNAVALQARKEGCEYLWALPRKETFSHAEKCGFIRTSDWIELDYGHNAYALMKL